MKSFYLEIERRLYSELSIFLSDHLTENELGNDFSGKDMSGIIKIFTDEFDALCQTLKRDKRQYIEHRSRAFSIRNARNRYAHQNAKPISKQTQVCDVSNIYCFLEFLIASDLDANERIDELHRDLDSEIKKLYSKEDEAKIENELIKDLGDFENRFFTQLEDFKNEVISKLDINSNHENITYNDEQKHIRNADTPNSEWFQSIDKDHWFKLSRIAKEKDLTTPGNRSFLYNMGNYKKEGWEPTEKQLKHAHKLYENLKMHLNGDDDRKPLEW